MEIFWSKVDKTDTCWIWTAGKDAYGYGQFQIKKKKIKPHRFAYEQLKGEIPKGYVIDHLCRNRLCCNPEHLEPVTIGENVRRGKRSEWTLNKGEWKTHCKRGHEYNEENTYRRPDGRRECKLCMIERRKK